MFYYIIIGIEIGFEESDVSVEEEAGEVQLCVKVQIFPNGPVSIKDVILEASPVYIGEASEYQLTITTITILLYSTN